MGDLAFPLFPFAKVLRTSPQNIVQEIVKRLNKVEGIPADSLLPSGPYLNVFIDISQLADHSGKV